MFANFVAGLIILLERPIRVGDVVTVDDITAREMIAMSDAGEQWLLDQGFVGEGNTGISTAIMFAHLTKIASRNM